MSKKRPQHAASLLPDEVREKVAEGRMRDKGRSRFILARETHLTHGRTRKSWTLLAALLLLGSAVRVHAQGLPFQTIAPAEEYDLRDENNRPIRDAGAQEQLRQAEVAQQFEAMFSGDLPRAAAVQDLLQRLQLLFLRLAGPLLPIFGFFDALTPPLRPESRPIAAGAFSSFAPALFAALAACCLTLRDRSRSIPQVLRC